MSCLCFCFLCEDYLKSGLYLHLLTVELVFYVTFRECECEGGGGGSLWMLVVGKTQVGRIGHKQGGEETWRTLRLVDFNAGKTQLVFFDRSTNTGAIDGKEFFLVNLQAMQPITFQKWITSQVFLSFIFNP